MTLATRCYTCGNMVHGIDGRVKGRMPSTQPDCEEGKIDWNGKERQLHGG